MKPAAEARPKRPYQAPKLTAYGDLTHMTLGSGGSGRMDQPHMMPRTAP
jgi:hypothetical protein